MQSHSKTDPSTVRTPSGTIRSIGTVTNSTPGWLNARGKVEFNVGRLPKSPKEGASRSAVDGSLTTARRYFRYKRRTTESNPRMSGLMIAPGVFISNRAATFTTPSAIPCTTVLTPGKPSTFCSHRGTPKSGFGTQ
ncbi:Uncharacterised protein [Mycobacteroides abscessus subsp. abscessus]|nr:Uncharacterised protein [Mycobacteroides abscessus subsp. abscessus]SII16704.1 Uncharacterised protein [Mycobacteroides abscessus subsp. abscessus]SLI87298.1 Uncharacterised protein [Mycobacteroides abscessus subsp. abscessus]